VQPTLDDETFSQMTSPVVHAVRVTDPPPVTRAPLQMGDADGAAARV